MCKKQVLLSIAFTFIFLFSSASFGMVKLTDMGSPASTGGGSSPEHYSQSFPIVTKLDKQSSSQHVMTKLKKTVNRFRSTQQLAKENTPTQK